MAYNYEYPYVDPNRYNSDWMLTKMKELEGQINAIISGLPDPSASDSMWANVKAFGAKGDGYTDDTAACQKAMDAGFNMVYFPPGNYMMGRVNVPSNTTVFAKKGSVTLRALDNVFFINKSDGVTGGYNANENITITGFKFDCVNRGMTAVAMGHANNIAIYNNHFENIAYWHFIEINGCGNVLITGNDFRNYNPDQNSNGSEMIQLDYMLNNEVFPWFGPYDKTFDRGIFITDNYFSNGYVPKNPGSNCAIGSHTGESEWGYEPHDVIIANNNFYLVGYALKFCMLVGAVIANNVADMVCGFYFAAAGGRFAFINITNNSAYGIFPDGSPIPDSYRGMTNISNPNSQSVHISGNTIIHFYGHGIAMQGTKNVIDNNYCDCSDSPVLTTNEIAGIYVMYNDQGCVYSNNETTVMKLSQKQAGDNAILKNNHANKLIVGAIYTPPHVYNDIYDSVNNDFKPTTWYVLNTLFGSAYIDKQGY